MNKLEIVNFFANKLNEFEIEFKRCNDYHIQINKVINFYPSKKSCYCSLNGRSKKFYPIILLKKEYIFDFIKSIKKND